jgi:hypothetical protein
MAQVVEHLTSKCEVLRSNTNKSKNPISQKWWYIPVISDTQETEIGRVAV